MISPTSHTVVALRTIDEVSVSTQLKRLVRVTYYDGRDDPYLGAYK